MGIPIYLDEKLAPSDLFHPGAPSQRDWHAGNKAASQLLGVRTLWTNLVAYIEAAQTATGLASRLQLKAAICELKMLVDVIPSLHGCIQSHPECNVKGLRPEISLSQEELQREHAAYRNLNQAKSRVESKLHALRSSIGAHFVDPHVVVTTTPRIKPARAGTRDRMSWEQITDCWESLDLTVFRDLIAQIEQYLLVASDLPIFEWYRYEQDGTLRTLIPPVGTLREDGTVEMQIAGREFIEKFNMNFSYP
jgi:hypothetical protein